MNANVPTGAAILLDFIGSVEVGKPGRDGYEVIYGNKQWKIAKPLTSMTLDEVQAAQRGWSKHHGSSAAGRYQFMRATLGGLMAEMGLRGSQHMTPDLQDAMGYHLLKRRGYARFIAGQMPLKEFALNLAKEWASMPVLEDTQGQKRAVVRGQSYCAGDGINKSLVSSMDFSSVLSEALNRDEPAPKPSLPPKPAPAPEPVASKRGGPVGWLSLGFTIVGGLLIGLWESLQSLWNWLF